MSIRKIVAVAVASAALVPAAYAASSTPASQCETLAKQFDTAAAANAASPNIAKAKKAAEDAAKLCKEGKPADGAKKYEHALKELGAKPN